MDHVLNSTVHAVSMKHPMLVTLEPHVGLQFHGLNIQTDVHAKFIALHHQYTAAFKCRNSASC